MARLQAKGFDTDGDPHAFSNGLAQILKVGEATVARAVYQPGWRWSTDMGEVAGNPTCRLHHLAYAISGELHVVTDDGQTLEIKAGSVYEIPPGHDAWVVGDVPFETIDWASANTWLAQGVLADSIVVTVVLTDIVDSTALLLKVGDWAWREQLATHNARLGEQVSAFRGRQVKSTGDGILAIFDSPSRAVRCAGAMSRVARGIDLPIRIGVHTGEVELVGEDIRGLAVHAAARVMGLGGADEVMVSSTTHDLLEGSNLALEDAGTHELKGLPGARAVYRLRPQAPGVQAT